MDGYGLVLAGGGARGSYEVGVWQAIRELGLEIVAVTGTSVGALNGAAMVQGDFDIVYSMWNSLAVKDVIKFQREIDSIYDIYKYPMDILPTIKSTISAGGLDTTPLFELMHNIIDEDKVRSSPIEFGLVTFSLSDLKPVEIFKEDIPEGQLIDYLLASACFPSFQPVEIDNRKFIDGGVYNNVPISLMMKKGIENLIVVDISNNGLPKNLDLTGLNIIHIEPSESLGGVLDFNSERSQLNIKLGYLDTLKAIGEVQGNTYYIKELPNRDSDKFNINADSLETVFSLLGIDPNDKSISINKRIINKVYKNIANNMVEDILKGRGSKIAFLTAMAEITAAQLKIDRRDIYSLKELNQLILDIRSELLDTDEFDDHIENLLLAISNIKESDIGKVVKNMPVIINFLPVFLSNPTLKGENIQQLRRVMAMTMTDISISSIYLYLLVESQEL